MAGRWPLRDVPRRRDAVGMATRQTVPATNDRIVELLEQVQAQLAEARKLEEKIAKDLDRLLSRG